MIVEMHDVAKRFRGADALRGLTLSIPEGSAFALIGANGAGKTTALKLLVNLLAPSSGRAIVLGVDSRRITHRQLERIGYVSENQVLPGRLKVGDYFDYLRPFYARWDCALEERVRKLLQLPAERRIRDLSHGMRMKMTLACGLPFQPELLILDEPLSGLDPLARDEVIESVLHQAGETAIVISSHELADIEHVVTDFGFIDAGQLLFKDSMSGLAARVREVRVVLEADVVLPQRVPQEWLDVRSEGRVLSFVDTAYSESLLGDRVRACVSGVCRIEAAPLALRSIFTALARAARERGTAVQ